MSYVTFSFVPNKMHPGKKRFLKMEEGEGGGEVLGYSLIIIKWAWGGFSQNLQFDPPSQPQQLGTKEYMSYVSNMNYVK